MWHATVRNSSKGRNGNKRCLTPFGRNGIKVSKKVGGSKRLTVNKRTGKITVKKKTTRGVYKIKVKVKAAGNSKYKALSKTVTLKVRIK